MAQMTRIQLGKFVPLACFTMVSVLAQTPPANDWGKLTAQATRRSAAAQPIPRPERLHSAALAMAEKLEPSDDRLAASLSNVATVYRAEGRYPEAEKLYRRALELRQGNLGAGHPEVAVVVNNLATLYHAEGRIAEAEPLFRRALAVWEQFPGQEDRHVATVLNNLAGIYRATGRFAEAEPLYRRALELFQGSSGPEDANVALVLSNLGVLYHNEGKFDGRRPAPHAGR